MYWSVSAIAGRGLVDQVRTALTELVAEMQAGMESGQEVPSASVVDQAVQVAVQGKKARVTVNAAQVAAGGGSSSVSSVPAQTPASGGGWKKLGAFVAGFASIAGLALGLAQWQHWISI